MSEFEPVRSVDDSETFAAQLARLIDLRKHDNGRPYTKREVAEDMAKQGYKVSKSHLYGLLNRTSKPSFELVQDFSRYFDVPLEYFSDTDQGRHLQAQYDLLAKFAEEGVRDLAFRASKLPSDKLRTVLDFIEFQASQADVDDHTSR